MNYKTFKSQLTPAAGQTLGFAKGKGYYIRRKPQAASAGLGALNPATPEGIDSIIGRFQGGLPAPLGDDQIGARARGLLDPVVQRITDQVNARAKAGSEAISGYTGSLAQALAAEVGNVHTAYAPSEQATAAAQSALADRLSGAGTDQASQLAARLASIGSPEVTGAAASQVQANGAGSGNALYGTGIAALEQMLGNEASGKGYAEKLPGLVRLTGAQELSQLQQSAQHDIADKTSSILDQLPGLVSQMRQDNETRRTNRSSVGLDLWKYLTGRNDALAVGKQKTAAAVTAAQVTADTKAAADAKKAADKQAADDKATAAKRQAALTTASSAAIDVFGNNNSASVTNQATGEKRKIKVKIGSPAYNEAISKAVAAVSDALSPYMTHAQIVQYVQAKAKAFFAPADPAGPVNTSGMSNDPMHDAVR